MAIDLTKYLEFMRIPENERKVRQAILDPQAVAYAWIEAYAKNLSAQVSEYAQDMAEDDDYCNSDSVTVDDLIQVGLSQLDTKDSWGGDYISRGGTFEGQGVDPMFWDKLSILIGQEIPSDSRNGFFSCSC